MAILINNVLPTLLIYPTGRPFCFGGDPNKQRPTDVVNIEYVTGIGNGSREINHVIDAIAELLSDVFKQENVFLIKL